MRSFFRKTGLVLALVSLVFFLSCERHHVDELPNVHAAQDETNPAAEGHHHHDAKSDQPTSTTNASHTAQTPEPRNSPANFFPDKPKP
jgi:hypothetical protein